MKVVLTHNEKIMIVWLVRVTGITLYQKFQNMIHLHRFPQYCKEIGRSAYYNLLGKYKDTPTNMLRSNFGVPTSKKIRKVQFPSIEISVNNFLDRCEKHPLSSTGFKHGVIAQALQYAYSLKDPSFGTAKRSGWIKGVLDRRKKGFRISPTGICLSYPDQKIEHIKEEKSKEAGKSVEVMQDNETNMSVVDDNHDRNKEDNNMMVVDDNLDSTVYSL